MPSSVEGLNQMVKSLLAAGAELTDIKDVFSDIADSVKAQAVKLAPRRSGKLQKSIKGSKRKNAAIVKAGGARVPYGPVVEYGWRRRNVEPQRYLHRAEDIVRPTVIPRLEQGIRDIMKKQGLAE